MATIYVGATVAGIDALIKRVHEATKHIVGDAAHVIQAAGMVEAPKGVSGNSTNASGDLARSIDVQGPNGAAGTYVANVGPTVIYGRQRELGGDIYPKNVAALKFTKFGVVYYRTHVYQKANPYMLRAEMTSLAVIETLAIDRIAKAVAPGG